VSEEDAASVETGKSAGVYWLIDPLDGTKEFIKRNGEFTCNLALIEEKRTTFGFVTVPAKEDLYVGGTNYPSTVECPGTEPRQIKHHKLNGVTRVVASKSHLNEETQAFIHAIEGEVEIVQAGSSLKFLKIATGDADIYPRLAPTCEWDTAAAHAVLNGAGGEVAQANGEPLVYGKNEVLNPHFIARALS
jgi:3'(2'), 5'-bisphosphate nucleotidase